jgi:beta-lactamase superfamily II metal-dependent hydrolase
MRWLMLWIADPLASWHMVNVNSGSLQGDANLITIGDQVIMIDAGYLKEAQAALIPYLREKNIRHVHHFFISHPHRDHY